MTSHSTTPLPPTSDSDDSWAHETALAAESASASRARDFVRKHLGEHDLAFLEGSLLVVVSELASNAVQHARTGFTVNLSHDGGAVLLAVRDDSAAEPILRPSSGTRTRGRGLMIVDQLTDDWGVEQGRGDAKSVWARFLTS